MAEGGFVWSGAGVPRVPCCEAGKSSDRCIHYDAPGLTQQEAIFHTEYGSYH